MNFFQLVSVTAFKAFYIFFAYGLLITAYIGLRYDFDTTLPDKTKLLLEGPVSIQLFSHFMFAGIVLIFLTATTFKKEINFETQRPKRIFWIALPVCEIAFGLGIVISGMLLGVSISAYLLFLFGITNVIIHPDLFSAFVFILLLTFPIAYIVVALLNPSRLATRWLNKATILYGALSFIIFITGLSIPDFEFIGLIMSVFMLGHMAGKKWGYF
jgi:hypothetical protein